LSGMFHLWIETMCKCKTGSEIAYTKGGRLRGFIARLRESRSGSTAIEFAILALPFFMVIFATIETFVAYNAEQVLANAVDIMARKIRTGQITFNSSPAKSTDMTEVQFRTAFCNQISIVITCSATEATSPSKLYIDLRTFTTFANIPTTIPRQSTAAYSDIDTSSFSFAPGGSGTINMLRAYYRWQITTDIVRPYITNIRPAGTTMPTDYLIVSTAAFKNEIFP
jgi:Flp pilus assembly protein TadG